MKFKANKNQPPQKKKIPAVFVIYRTRGEKNLWDQMLTTTLIVYWKRKRIMSPRGCWLKMWSLMQAALASQYCFKKNKFSGPNPELLNQNLWSGNQKTVFYQLFLMILMHDWEAVMQSPGHVLCPLKDHMCLGQKI